MSVTRENRKIRDYLRKRLIRLAEATGGEVHERSGSGGKTVSTYKWSNARGEKSFRISWHNSVSDRHFPKKIRGEIKRNLINVSELFYEEPSTRDEFLEEFGVPGRNSLANDWAPSGMALFEMRMAQLLKPLRDVGRSLIGPLSENNPAYWDEEERNPEEYPNDVLCLMNRVRQSQFDTPDDIYAFEDNVLFLFYELDEISMLYANRSLLGWCERTLFWWRRRSLKFYKSEGVLP